MMVFRVLKWLALALAIIVIKVYDLDPAGLSTERLIVGTMLFVLFAIFFHLEQVES